jgi:hypothetical protein
MTNKGRQAAAQLKISRTGMYELIKQGILPKPPRKKFNSKPEWTVEWIIKAKAILK